MAWNRNGDTRTKYPQVWCKFKGRRPLSDGRTFNFKIQDVPQDMFPRIIQFMTDNFMRDEPCCKIMGVHKDRESVYELHKMWFEALQDRVSLVCLVDDPEDSENTIIAGVNVLAIAHKNQEKKEIRGEVLKKVYGAVMVVDGLVDIFEKYKLDEYLTAIGLSVDPRFRGQSIGFELLKARIPLCKSIGIKLTGTVFTATESQTIATKCGFQVEAEMTYEELASKYGFVYPGLNVKSSMNMSMMIR